MNGEISLSGLQMDLAAWLAERAKATRNKKFELLLREAKILKQL